MFLATNDVDMVWNATMCFLNECEIYHFFVGSSSIFGSNCFCSIDNFPQNEKISMDWKNYFHNIFIYQRSN